MNLSFAGCGFQGIYHLGAVACLKRHGHGVLKDVKCFAGASAGSLTAALLATSTPIEHGVQFTTELATKARKQFLGALSPSFDIMKHLHDGLHNFLPEDAHQRACGKLHVSLTSFPQRNNVIVSHFESRDELIQVLLASCYIPIYGGMKFPVYKGEKWFDGGFSDNLPVFDSERTIRITPFYGDFDICPRDKNSYNLFTAPFGKNMEVVVNYRNIQRGFHALFPPSKRHLERLYNCGYNDALRFLGIHISK